jgi:hypothetical protein
MDSSTVFEQNWKSLADKAKSRFLGLNDAELKAVDGKYDVMVELLREKYGYSRIQAEAEVDRFLEENTVHPAANPV